MTYARSIKNDLLDKSVTVSYIVAFDKTVRITQSRMVQSSGDNETDRKALKLITEATPVSFSKIPEEPLVVCFYSGDVSVGSATPEQCKLTQETLEKK